MELVLVALTCVLLFVWCYPQFHVRWLYWKAYKKTGKRKLPPFIPFPLPFFGHSLQLRSTQEPFVLNNHKKYGPIFGFYMQDQLFFCLDIVKYQNDVNSCPNVTRNPLQRVEGLTPYMSIPKTSLSHILRGAYVEQLKTRLPFIQKQLKDFLEFEFPDPTQTYTRDASIFDSLTACYTLASWCNLDYSQMQKENMIKMVCEYSSATLHWRDSTLIMPRLVFLARMSLKKYGRIIENFIAPLFPLLDKKDQDGQGPKCLLQMIKDKTDQQQNTPKTVNDELLNNMIMFLPGAMSISPTLHHLFSVLPSNEFLSQVEEEQMEIYNQNGNNITSNCLNKMQVLDLALKETLRLEFTLASFRIATDDIILHDGFVIPSGSNFIFTGCAINYDETLFPNSHEWNPQRWIEFEAQKGLKFSQKKDAFIWGSGKVMCPGQAHATIGMKLISSLLLRDYSCQFTNTGQFTFKARKTIVT